jgi:hypothetical protein
VPWTPKQMRLFQAAAHNPQIAAAHHMSPYKAKQMSSEGVMKVSDALALRKIRPLKPTTYGY